MELVPCGIFSKFNINLKSEFSSPLSDLKVEDYASLLSFDSTSTICGSSESMKSALDILKFNTEYPISASEDLTRRVNDNYKNEILASSEISIKYKGYIQREQQMADKISRLENLNIPEGFDFDKVESLSIECRQKLKRYSPRTIAQASRISGVSPSDISVLIILLESQEH